MINHLLSDTNHSRDVFINEFKARYSNPLPPIWMMVEIMSMGEISKWYREYICDKEKREISSYYKLHHSVLASWIHMLSIIRNRCAHHNRLYGVSISGGLKIPKNKIGIDSYKKLFSKDKLNSFYNLILASCYIVDVIGRGFYKCSYLIKIKNIIQYYHLKEKKLGFPDNMTIDMLMEKLGICAG